MTHSHLPTAIDLRALAQSGQPLAGEAPLLAFKRLADDLPDLPEAPLAAQGVRWQIQAEWRDRLSTALTADIKEGLAGQPQLWLHLAACASVPQTCQRCLSAFAQPVEVDRWFRFVADEATALAQDDDSEEDLLVIEPRFNLHELVEDELLMALPLVPMHDTCPAPVRMQAGTLEEVPGQGDRPNPFAALASLKTGASGKGQPD